MTESVERKKKRKREKEEKKRKEKKKGPEKQLSLFYALFPILFFTTDTNEGTS